MEYADTNNIKTYRKIVEIRTILKQVQQLSWDITNVEKRYPLDKVSEIELEDVLGLYQDLKQRLLEVDQNASLIAPF